MSTKRQREQGSCTGRGFSMIDPDGYMAHLLSWLKRPNANGAMQECIPDFEGGGASDTFGRVGHGYLTGDSVEITITPGGTLPAGLTAGVEYYLIKSGDDAFTLAATHFDAMAGTPVTITDNGSGTIYVNAKGSGANWYLYDDFSRITPMDFATTDVDLDTDVITVVAHGLSHRHRVTFTSTGTVPNGLTAGVVYWIIRLTADTFKVADSEANAFAGTAVDITSIGSGTHTVSTAEHFVVMTDTLNPVVNDYNTSPGGIAPKFLKLGYVNSESGYVRMQALCWWDNTVHTGYGYWSGFWMRTYDSALFAYQFLGGDEYFFQASQLGATWYKMLIDNFTGFSSKLEAITKVGILQSGVTAGSSVVLQLDSGQAANFTVNKYYYLYDFQSHSWVNYCKVTAREVMSDTVTINNCNQDFPAGSVLTPYAHRYYIYGAGENQWDTNMTPVSPYTGLAEGFQIPYCSHTTDQTAVFHPQNRAIYLQANFITGDPYVDVGSPDDEGFYDCIKTVIAEKISNVSYYDRTSQNRIYGKSNNVLRTARGSMGQMTNYRTLEGIDYLNISDSGQTYSYMVTYSTSAG